MICAWPVSDEIIDSNKGSKRKTGLLPVKPPQFKYGDSVALVAGLYQGPRDCVCRRVE